MLVVRVCEDVCSEQSVKQCCVHGGDDAQARRPHHQHVARYMFTVSCEPAGHPAQRTDTEQQKPERRQEMIEKLLTPQHDDEFRVIKNYFQ